MPIAHTSTTLHGVGVSQGHAAGPVVRVVEGPGAPVPTSAPADPETEAARIRPAATAVSDTLSARAESLHGEPQTVLMTTAAMAADPSLLARAEELVTTGSRTAPQAVIEAAEGFAETLRAAGGYLAERVRDIQDVRDRLVAELTGQPMPGVPWFDEPSVIIARDLAPADTADLDPERVLALVTEEGGPTSHTAIIARSLGIPAVVAVRGLLDTAAHSMAVDGTTGTVEATQEPLPVVAARPREHTEWSGTGATSDGHPVPVLANVGSAADAVEAADAGAQGVGLFRTEFCFLDAAEEPSADAQRAAYRAVLTPLSGKPVVVRTLDAGADKPLPFLRAAAEPNPALGVRGLRIAVDSPDVLRRQLEAIAAAAADTATRVSVMAPMVATGAEAAWFAEQARAAGIDRVGVMIEIPAAAFNAPEILDAVDFVSIGTNDLAQYTFAADRMTGALAALNDPWQPGLLRLLAMLGEAGRERDVPVGVCGEAAADPMLGGLLAGLGVTSLSMATAAIPAVGAALAEHSLETWRRAADAARGAGTPEQARQAARAALG